MKHLQSKISTTELLFNGAMVFGLSGVTYWIITHGLTRVFSVSRDDDLLGGMWAVVATVFVYRVARVESVDAALTRISATSLSFVLCFIYLLFFPFHYWGMAALLGLGTILMPLFGRSDAAVTTNITTTVVMVVAAMTSHPRLAATHSSYDRHRCWHSYRTRRQFNLLDRSHSNMEGWKQRMPQSCS